MTRSDIIRFLILRTIGNFLVLFALFGVFATFGPALYYEIQYRIVQARGIEYTVVDSHESTKTPLGRVLEEKEKEVIAEGGLAEVLSGPKQQILIPKDPKFGLVIPKIGANSTVIPNVDSSNEKEFLPILYQGIAHAKGTVFPGIPGNIYLFAHSSDNFWDVGRYNAVFYLLKDLTKGDDVVVFFENKRHNYVVSESVIVEGSDVSELVKSQEVGEERLILQTCWPPGTTWKRLLVIARPR